MSNQLVRTLRRLSLRPSIIKSPLSLSSLVLGNSEPNFIRPKRSLQLSWLNNQLALWRRSFSHGSVSLVISPQGKPKFEIHEIDPPKKEKWKTKKRLKLQRMREKKKRKAANTRDPRKLTVKRKKQRFATAEEIIKYKIENARTKEALLIERLKKYEVPKSQGPIVEPHVLTGEERFYMKKMAQKKSNYVPVGRRGIFGGVILNMHLHWKKHETVKVFCKPCKAGQVQEYANEIARLSGGIPIQIIGDDTIIFYRGKNYVQPEVMSPVDTLSKKRALEKSKYEQSLESVQHFIAVAEKELELYYRHVALYSDPNDKASQSIPYNSRNEIERTNQTVSTTMGKSSQSHSEEETGDTDEWISEIDDNYEHGNELDSEDDIFSENLVSSDESVEDDTFSVQDGSCDIEEGIVTHKS